MEEMIQITLQGKSYWLHFSVKVMFAMQAKFATLKDAMELIVQDTPEGFDTVRWFAIKMAEDGELCRRAMGHEKSTMLSAEEFTHLMTPHEFSCLREAVVEAISFGYHSEVKPDKKEEIDLGLQEIQKKTEPQE